MERFQQSFDRAISFSIFRKESDTPFLEIEMIVIDEEERGIVSYIDLSNIHSYDDVGRMFENAFLLEQVQRNVIDLPYLDLLIQDRSQELGYTISARLVLRDDVRNITIDSVSHTSDFVRRLFSNTYIAERVVASPQNQFTIRAEYQIAQQGAMLRMSIAIVVSAVASVVIILVLLLLGRTLKRKHDELQELQASFDGAIHDLKSPLAYTYASLTALEDSIKTPAKKMAVAQSADRVLFLSEKITLMLRSTQNITQVSVNEQERVFVYDTIEQICVEIHALFPSKKTEFNNRIDTDLSLFAAPFLFEAVVRILLENAVRHNDNEPIIAVTGIRDENNVRITITDNGKGIAKRRLKHLFKPYRTSDKISGTGIGLYYAHTIVKAHGGTISVESEEGKGSTFTVVMPYRRSR